LAVLLLVGATTSQASAHAVLLRSFPSSRQSLAQAPQRVQLLFSESIDPVFSSVRVVDAAGRQVDRGDAHVDENDDHQLVVSIQSNLPNGVYSVVWRSLSTIDIHPDEGRYQLFVGVPVSTESVVPATSASTATPATTLGRWWFYLSGSLFGGVLAMWKLVLMHVLVDERADVRDLVRRRVHRLIVVGGVLLILGTLFAALAQAAAAADVPLTSAFGQPLADLLLRGRFAAIWWPRLGLELASVLLVAFGGLEGMAADCALATLPAVLLTSSLTSHGAGLASATGLGIAIDWLHIAGATAWIGGLTGVLVALPALQRSVARDALKVLLARFGRFALIASAIVLLSGALQAALELGSVAALIESSYGQLVLVKIGLLVSMLLLAGFNEWRGRRTAPVEGGRALGRGVRMELALGVVVLAVAAVLSGTPPSRELVSAPVRGALLAMRVSARAAGDGAGHGCSCF
jgi:copper transport protein